MTLIVLKRLTGLSCLLLCACTFAFGQEKPDSLVSYSLSEIVIGGEARHSDYIQRLFRVRLSKLAQQDKADISGVLRQLPSAHLQTNSRGETLVYIRASGERQVAVFLDGAPLNIGWDNRIDLSMIPANVLGDITLERGALSAAYGPNVSGGAVSLHSRSLLASGTIHEATIQLGHPGSWQSRLMAARRKGKTSILVGGTVSKSDGFRVSDSARLPFSQNGSIRTNSDRSSATIYARLDREAKMGSFGVTLLHASSAKGVSPEGHLDPTIESIRYWRYPVWRNSMAIFNAVKSNWPVHLFTTIWISRFQQEIDQYEDDSYTRVSLTQADLDLSAGIRAIAEWKASNTSYRGIGFVSSTSHKQVDSVVSTSKEVAGPDQYYRNVLFSVGAEVSTPNKLGGHWVAGFSIDGMSTPSTGDKLPQPSMQAWSVNFETNIKLSKRSSLLINAGSKPRFPTLRELYGVALNRFILNNDLQSERSWTSEAGFVYANSRYSFQMTGFAIRTVDTIDQKNVVVEGLTKRQRINLDGSSVIGAELSGAFRISERFSVDGHGTLMRPRKKSGKSSGHLTEKPEMLMTLNGEARLTSNTRLISTLIYVGKAYGLGTENEHILLPTSLEWNLRIAQTVYFSSKGLFLEAYAGADNVFDSLTLPQLGLPAPGRSLRFGINLSY
jgi:iron complex outermembrane recepter protein